MFIYFLINLEYKNDLTNNFQNKKKISNFQSQSFWAEASEK